MQSAWAQDESPQHHYILGKRQEAGERFALIKKWPYWSITKQLPSSFSQLLSATGRTSLSQLSMDLEESEIRTARKTSIWYRNVVLENASFQKCQVTFPKHYQFWLYWFLVYFLSGIKSSLFLTFSTTSGYLERNNSAKWCDAS